MIFLLILNLKILNIILHCVVLNCIVKWKRVCRKINILLINSHKKVLKNLTINNIHKKSNQKVKVNKSKKSKLTIIIIKSLTSSNQVKAEKSHHEKSNRN